MFAYFVLVEDERLLRPHLVVNNMLNVWDVEASCRHISRKEDAAVGKG